MTEQMVNLLCGEETVDLRLPESVRVLEMEPTEPLADPDGAVRQALADPIESPPLKELVRGKKDACVVISDITRPVPNQIILPPMLNILEESDLQIRGYPVRIRLYFDEAGRLADLYVFRGDW